MALSTISLTFKLLISTGAIVVSLIYVDMDVLHITFHYPTGLLGTERGFVKSLLLYIVRFILSQTFVYVAVGTLVLFLQFLLVMVYILFSSVDIFYNARNTMKGWYDMF